MNIEWKDSYRIGEEAIDRQHQELFVLANAMFGASDKGALRLCAIQLYQHVREHFADEEALMKMVAFPGYKAHVESHNRILKNLGEVSHAIGKDAMDPKVVVEFLTDWGLKHIPHDDAQVAAFVKAHCTN
jgi:hemerythrin-like metal-binding protein